MDFELTPAFAGKSIAFMLVGYVLALVFQLYMLYLNWKQSKVQENTTNMLNELREIRKLLEKAKK